MSQVCPKLSMTWDGVEVLVLETKGLASRPQVSQLSRVSQASQSPMVQAIENKGPGENHPVSRSGCHPLRKEGSLRRDRVDYLRTEGSADIQSELLQSLKHLRQTCVTCCFPSFQRSLSQPPRQNKCIKLLHQWEDILSTGQVARTR